MMCSLPHNPKNKTDYADRVSTCASLALLTGLAFGLRHTSFPSLTPGEIPLYPPTAILIEIASSPSEPTLIEQLPEPPPILEEPVEPDIEEPEPEPTPTPPPTPEPPPVEAAQPPIVVEGDKGEEEAPLRAEWLAEFRRRIERHKYYPGAARYAGEAGTVTLLIGIGADARIETIEIVSNTGSPLLAEGAESIVRRATETPLSSRIGLSGFHVRVPFSFRMNP